MEINVRKMDLFKELLLMQGVVERKTTIPILSNVLAEATADGRLRLAATDLELGMVTECPAVVKKSGACAIPARKLLDYVRLLPDADISIKLLENHWIQIRCGKANTRMVGMSKENFPVLPAFPSGGTVKIPAAVLADMIRKTIFAISNEESRYTLNGALMVLKPENLSLVATDGHRLAHISAEKVALEGVTSEIKALVPKKAMAELQSLLAEVPEGGTIEFGRDDTHLFFRGTTSAGNTRLLTARQLTGQFPNYEAVLPKENRRQFTVGCEEASSAIRRVSQFADERSHAIRLRLEKDHVVLTSSSSDSGESDEELDAPYEAEPMVIGFNSQYLLDFLAAANSEEVVFEFKDEQSAGQLRPKESNGFQYRYVIMPMRI
jgi:DNA polymerase-3 subunit beta